MFVASVAERFRREAPQARLSLHALGPSFDFERSLAEGDLDVVIGNWPELPHRMHLSMLLEDEIVPGAASHPCAKKGMSGRRLHARRARGADAVFDQPARGHRRRAGAMRISRDERVAVQSFTAAPYLLQGTDLVFTTTGTSRSSTPTRCRWRSSPRRSPFHRCASTSSGIERNHHSTGHRWLRRLLSDCGRRIAPPHA